VFVILNPPALLLIFAQNVVPLFLLDMGKALVPTGKPVGRFKTG
jgi:hypothetical protein